MKHTPGPWTYRKNPMRDDGWFAYEANGKTLLFGQVSDADARLIAAAPELLEACKFAVVAPIFKCRCTIEDDSLIVCAECQVKSVLENAIAKAEGGL